jgi:hypothetical protein
VVALAGSLAVACETDASTCPIDDPGRHQPYCINSIVLAVRLGDKLVVEQEDVDEYYDLLRPALHAEPVLRLVYAFDQDSNETRGCTVYTRHEPLVSAWMTGDVVTGDATIDSVFAENGAIAVEYLLQDFDGNHLFYVEWKLAMNWSLFDEVVTSVPATSLAPDHALPPSEDNDIWLSWDGDTPVADFHFGWGDCFTVCDGVHHWRARFGGDDEVEVQDLGGDPVPDPIREGAEARPPPP